MVSLYLLRHVSHVWCWNPPFLKTLDYWIWFTEIRHSLKIVRFLFPNWTTKVVIAMHNFLGDLKLFFICFKCVIFLFFFWKKNANLPTHFKMVVRKQQMNNFLSIKKTSLYKTDRDYTTGFNYRYFTTYMPWSWCINYLLYYFSTNMLCMFKLVNCLQT